MVCVRCLASGRAARAAIAAAALLGAMAAPARAEHRARLSADLADHLAAGSQTIDVIVHGDAGHVDTIATRYNLVVFRRLRSGAVLRVNAGQLDALQKDPDLDHLSGDVPIRSTLAVTTQAIGADQVWDGADGVPGRTGRGVTVAVIDSGIDARHQALKNRVVASVDFTGGDGLDRFGHGTHVAGIIAAQAGQTPDTRNLRGVASGASLVSLRVLGDDGSGTISSVVEAIDWAVEHRKQFNIGIINLSLGAPVLQPYRDDPLCEAAERAVAAGIVFVAAAGNFGRTADGRIAFGGITSPGNDPLVLTAGAIDTQGTPARADDVVAPYSSRGPTRYDLVIKPDVVAPGSRIVSTEAAGSYLAKTYPERHVTGGGRTGYIQLSGTSMATGVVSGTVALLLEDQHRLKPTDVKVILQATSTFLPAAGLLGGGAGNVSAVGATAFLSHPAPKRMSDSSAIDSAAPSPTASYSANVERSSTKLTITRFPLLTFTDTAMMWGTSIVWDTSIIWDASIVWDT